MKTASPFIKNVLPWLAENLGRKKACALVTLVGVEGSSPRPVGSQMAVNADGEFVGQISAGCAEAAIISEALNCLKCNNNECVRYGKDSPYLDVVLPCGSSIDVHFLPLRTNAEIDFILKRLEARKSVWVSLPLTDPDGSLQINRRSLEPHHINLKHGFVRDDDAVYVRYDPAIHLLVFGRGTIVRSVTSFASALEMEVAAYSPDKATLGFAQAVGASACHHLVAPEINSSFPTDKRTAAVLLFHDHEWEPPLLQRLLATECFYIGAMGSRKTHSIRLDLLAAMGVAPENYDRIHGPIGLNIKASTPPEIALSIVAEIVEVAASLKNIDQSPAELDKAIVSSTRKKAI